MSYSLSACRLLLWALSGTTDAGVGSGESVDDDGGEGNDVDTVGGESVLDEGVGCGSGTGAVV